MAMSQEIELDAHDTVELAFITTAGTSRHDVLYQLHQYQDWHAIRRVVAQTHTAAELEMRRLNITSDGLATMQQLLSALLYPSDRLRAPADVIAANELGQPALWPYAISGDYPILLVCVEDEDGLALVQEALRAHRYWRNRNMPISLVILNEKASSYVQALHDQVGQLLQRNDHRNWLNRRAGIFLLRNDQLTGAAKTLLQTAARVVLEQEDGTLAAQVHALHRQPAALPLFQPGGRAEEPAPLAPLPRPAELQFDNGLGGFSADGREYLIYLEPGQTTPAPWSNVIANPTFGFLMTERGSSFTWAVNSGENRLTPWSNDPVVDPTGEALYLRDEETARSGRPPPRRPTTARPTWYATAPATPSSPTTARA
ncbi:MAG: hypothetical protein R2851_03660 [Caldilineaceae bacterium]